MEDKKGEEQPENGGLSDRTYVTFCLYHDDLDPSAISIALELEPTSSHRKGELYQRGARPPAATGGWFLTSKDYVHTLDLNQHLGWLLDRLEPKGDVLRQLQEEGYQMDIACYWLSAAGQGGPIISPAIMTRLGAMSLALWFDIYHFGGLDD